MNNGFEQRCVWSEPIASFDSFTELKANISARGRFAIKRGSERRPFQVITYQCTQIANKECTFRLKARYSKRTGQWALFQTGDHMTHDGAKEAKGMKPSERSLVDQLISDFPWMSAAGIADLTLQHDHIHVGVERVTQRMKYLNVDREIVEPEQFDGSTQSLERFIQKYISTCRITRDTDKPIVKLIHANEPGRCEILISTRALFDLVKKFGANCIYVDATFGVFKPHTHKLLTCSIVDGAGKYYTCIYQVSLSVDKIAYKSLATAMKRWAS